MRIVGTVFELVVVMVVVAVALAVVVVEAIVVVLTVVAGVAVVVLAEIIVDVVVFEVSRDQGNNPTSYIETRVIIRGVEINKLQVKYSK